MDRDLLQKRIARLTSLENVGSAFRDGRAIYLRARAFAIKAHLGQMYGDNFYTCHLEQVENVLIRYDCCSFRIRATAWLHDTVEKSDVTMKDINREFPGFIASIVDAVTRIPGNTREQRNSGTYLRIKERGGMAIVLKLADRIAEVEEVILTDDRKLAILPNGYSEFRDALYAPGSAEAMWRQLDALDEIGNQMVNRQTMIALANRVSLPNVMSIPQPTGSVNRLSPE
jgi:guanosine-3',5'-bis(diphosphate) 3'-pyrophosphohydrolase